MSTKSLYKVVLVFNLTKGSADEEILRSIDENSFPNMLAKQAGFIDLELVKINEEKTMSIQTWESEKHWWSGLESVKNLQEKIPSDATRESILVSRDFLNGYVNTHIEAKKNN